MNLWEEVGNQCLARANELLKTETACTEDTVKAVQMLVNIAVSIDMLNLRRAQQNRAGEVLPDLTNTLRKYE